eukprot:gene11205-12497_t
MNRSEIENVRKEIQAIKDVLNYRVAMKKAVEKGLLPLPALTLDDSFLMYEEMDQERLHRQLEQLQEKENLILRGVMLASKALVDFRGEIIEFSIPLYSEGVVRQYEVEYLEIKTLPVMFYERYGKIPSRIYIRPCYKKLYDIVTLLMPIYQGQLPATLFTGVPGIGKSLFLIYFLFRFLFDERFSDKRFVLELGLMSGEYHYFVPEAEQPGVFECSITSHGKCPLLEVPIFSDLKDMAEPRCKGKWLFIFSSPNPLRYKQTMNNSPKFRYTLPTWSYFELLCIESDDEKWIDRFILFGGVPRSIFWDGVEGDSQLKLEDALESKGGIIADYFFKHGFGSVDPEKSYMLLHMNPPWSPSDNDWLYDRRAIHSFASDMIFKRIAEKHQSRILAEPINLFNAGVAPVVYGGGSAGNLFEKICLWLKPIAGQTISAQSMQTTETYNISLPAMAVLEYHWKENARDDESKKLLPNILYQPKISNLESGDAFCVFPSGFGQDGLPVFLLVVLQITVGESHPVKVNGLHDIILAYPESIHLRIVKKILVFVTPLDGKLNSVQPLHTQENKVAQVNKIDTLVQNFEQCVCKQSV